MNPKQKRNDKCSCNSGKKYKKCCLLEIKNPEITGVIYVDKVGLEDLIKFQDIF